MNALEGILEEQHAATFACMSEALKPFDEINKKFCVYMARINEVIEKYARTGVVPDLLGWENWEDVADGKTTERRNSTKENIEPKKEKKQDPGSPPQRRTRRNAFMDASKKITNQSNVPTDGDVQKVYIKKEKLTMSNVVVVNDESTTNSDTIDSVALQLPVKKEEVEEMPAPSRPAPRRKKRKGSELKVKLEKLEKEEEKRKTQLRDSDVVVQDVTVTIIQLDCSDDGEKTLKEATKRKSKRLRNLSSEDESRTSAEKRPKSDHDNPEYEDASSSVGGVATNNATFVAKPAPAMDATVVVDNPKYVASLNQQSTNDMVTDDGFEEEIEVKTVPKRTGGIPVAKKPIFSPFVQSPVMIKVHAFEKLHEEASAVPPRITRTKTRAQAKKEPHLEEDATKGAVSDDEQRPNTNVREKAKIFTPVAMKFAPKAASTTLKSNRVVSSSSSNEKSVLSAKSASALKASQAEYREREKKRHEREQEALKKREALLQAQIEEKKRKREEKQLKAQQQREVLEKEKLKALDAQRLKDERHKQLVAEQEALKLRQKEEQEKKRQKAKMRALEERRREEEKRLDEQKKTEEMALQLAKRDKDIARMVQEQKEKKVPIYMRTRALRLPTPDCYDSDEEGRGEVEVTLPDWCDETHLHLMQKCASTIGERIKNSFFSIQAQTPDLQDIFEDISAKKLQRNSSAVWHKPPRFTMMPDLGAHDETEEFDEDSE